MTTNNIPPPAPVGNPVAVPVSTVPAVIPSMPANPFTGDDDSGSPAHPMMSPAPIPHTSSPLPVAGGLPGGLHPPMMAPAPITQQMPQGGPMAAPVVNMGMGQPPPSPGMPMAAAPAAVPSPPPIVEWFAGSDLHGAPPTREWLIKDMIPMNTVTLMQGDGGTGKSLLALQLAASLATGRPWLPGKWLVAGRTVYISAEDDRPELHRRLSAIAEFHHVNTTDFAGITIADLASKDALLASVGKDGTLRPSLLFELINTKIASIAPRLVVIDTLADTYPGNENDRAQARQFISLLRRIAMTHQCAVLLLAHPSLTGINTGTGASGSTGWNNSVRSRLYFERIKDTYGNENDPNARRLKVMKSNYGLTGIEIPISWKNGVFIGDQEGGNVDVNARAERVFISLIEQLAGQGRYLSHNYAPKTLSEMPTSEGLTKKAMKDAMERLFVNGKIGMREIIENRRPRSVIMILP
jgi:RecA-family ATPase